MTILYPRRDENSSLPDKRQDCTRLTIYVSMTITRICNRRPAVRIGLPTGCCQEDCEDSSVFPRFLNS